MPNTIYCSFCGKNQHEVEHMIAGPKVFICDECIELCTDIIAEKRREKQKSVLGVIESLKKSTMKSCEMCNGHGMMGGGFGVICETCEGTGKSRSSHH